jgi:hypothetical protein
MDKLKFDSFSSFASSVQTQVQENKKGAAIVAGASAAGLGALYLARRAATAVPKSGAYGFGTLPSDAYDAAIVGAGPSGSVCGFYMAKSGAKVALLDKETFPRDKYCGDAVCTPAIRILEDMGVLAELKANNEAHFADAGGFVSPSGISYIGASKEKLGQAACCAVKRINLDVRIARAAQRKGADLKEGFEVTAATFDKAAGLWTVTAANGSKARDASSPPPRPRAAGAAARPPPVAMCCVLARCRIAPGRPAISAALGVPPPRRRLPPNPFAPIASRIGHPRHPRLSHGQAQV